MVAYRQEQVEAVIANIAIASALRIVPNKHLSTPLGTGPSDSRFCTKDSGYTVLYSAADFATAFIETIVRDRFMHKAHRELLFKEISARGWVMLSTKPRNKLKLLDLRGDGCTRLGAPTDVVNARNHAAGRALGQTISRDYDADGFVFTSRLTGVAIYAVYDRAINKLIAIETGALKDHNGLPDVLKHHRITLLVHR